jgi:hypothetical protein
MEQLKIDFDLAVAWIKQSGREWVSEHKEITAVGLVVLLFLVSCD